MSTRQSVEQDERAVAVIGVSSRWAFVFLYFGICIDGAYRATVLHQNTLDLIALVLGSLIISTIYQARHKVLGKTWVKAALFGALCGVLPVVFGVVFKVVSSMIQAR